jgi:hypothetical protein
MSEFSPQSVSRFKRAIAAVLLGAVLIQVLLFFVGLLVPMRRVAMMWGKSFEDRQLAVWQPGRVISQVARQFPPDAKIYFEDPDLLLHWNMVYYFYPRLVTVTMTNGNYRSREAYAAWNERPTEEWLISNKFTHVLSYKGGALQARSVKPPAQSQNATVK